MVATIPEITSMTQKTNDTDSPSLVFHEPNIHYENASIQGSRHKTIWLHRRHAG